MTRRSPADIAETRHAVIVGRPDGVILHVNDAFTRLTGVSAGLAVAPIRPRSG